MPSPSLPLDRGESKLFHFANRDDWRIVLLEDAGLSSEVLGYVIEEMLPGTQDRVVTILEPGRSGAHVVLVTFTDAGNSFGTVLKIAVSQSAAVVRQEEDVSLRIERRTAKAKAKCSYLTIRQVRRVTHHGKTWFCSSARFEHEKLTFKQHLRERILVPDFDLNATAKIFRQVIEAYMEGPWTREVVKTYNWSGKDKHLKSLEQKEHYSQYVREIYQVVENRSFCDLRRAVDIDPDKIRELLGFIKENRYRAQLIDPNLVDVPISEVHGDLNGGNVLVDQRSGENPIFIDMGQMSVHPDRHALFDLGKLSIDFERFILPGEIFHRDLPGMLRAWVDIHLEWITGGSTERYNTEPYRILHRLYAMLSQFRDLAIEQCEQVFAGQVDLSRDEWERHFLLVRLHHVLRMINHPELEGIRKAFAIRAALDILDRLTKSKQRVVVYRQPSVSFDCTKDEFESRLAHCRRTTIIGVTNENLRTHLENAYQQRKVKNKPEEVAWEEIKVVFLSRKCLHLTANVDERRLEARYQCWENAVQSIRSYLLEGGRSIAKRVEVRQSQGILPFVGQMYDENDLRVAFVLPGRDVKQSCYLNLKRNTPPCADPMFVPFENRRLKEDRRCRTTILPPAGEAPCDQCEWKTGHSPCRGIADAIGHVLADSTPMFTANVVGSLDSNRFSFRHLVPEHRWRQYQSLLQHSFPEKPVHLVSFVLLHCGDDLYLQFRTEQNSSDNLDKYGVLPGKVNDEDFFDESLPYDSQFRRDIYELQMAWHSLDESADGIPQKIHDQMEALEDRFRKIFSIPGDAPVIPAQILDRACRKAAVRTLRGKLGLHVEENRLRLLPGHFDVDRDNHSLRVRLYVLKLRAGEPHKITTKTSAPFANIQRVTRTELTGYGAERLTEFLLLHREAVIKQVFGTGSKPQP